MKKIINITSIVTILMLFSTIVCGLWIKANNVVEASSLQFHSTLGILSGILTTILLIVLMIRVNKNK